MPIGQRKPMGTELCIRLLIFHNLNHHPGSQPKTALEQQAIRHSLKLSHTIHISGEQAFLLVCKSGLQLFLIAADQLKQLFVLFGRRRVILCLLDVAVSKFF
ncbi:hypothetical protein DFS30_05695 [Akkermansia muciniphila]|nr:hypothetical protein CUC06_05655 [Akkermansia muciniphila]MBD9262093.1 hypothetical protein [Akkermansia muciniphila]PNC70108.1 hypothetical protein CXU04_10785 [Akkermansia muciniphila]PNC75837.1 hypothetical protein CXT98_01165 [Akkermansia muciniphila]QAA38835.1 hypothetical protein C1I90_05985 [Akkermansia muciniphila]